MKRFKNSWKWLVALGAVFVPSALLAAVTIPNTFSAGNVIKSSEVNDNFSTLATAVNKKADSPASGSYVATPAGRLARAYVDCLSTSGTCKVSHSYNPGGSAITVAYSGTGSYQASFPNFNVGADVGIPVVSSYGSSPNRCKVSSWSANAVGVHCYNASGSSTDSLFTILFVK